MPVKPPPTPDDFLGREAAEAAKKAEKDKAEAVAKAEKDKAAAMAASAAKQQAALDKVKSAVGSTSGAFEKLTGAFSGLTSRIDSMIGKWVALANPASYQKFQLAVRDAGAVLGQILTPVLDKATKMIRYFADALLNANPKIKKGVENMASSAVGMAAGSAVAAAGMAGLTGILAAAGVSLGPFAALLAPLVPLFGLLGASLGQMKGLEEVFGKFLAVARGLMVVFSGIAEAIAPMISGLLDEYLSAWQEALPQLGPLVDLFIMLAKAMVEIVKATLPLSREMFPILIEVFKSLGDILTVAVIPVVLGLVQAFVWVGKGIAKFVSYLFELGNKVNKWAGGKDRGEGVKDQFKMPKFDFKAPGPFSSVGAAVAPATYSTFRDIGQKARQTAFGEGAANPELDEQKRATKALVDIKDLLSGLSQEMQDSIGGFFGLAKAQNVKTADD